MTDSMTRMPTLEDADRISPLVACDLAGVSYRRFDYWIRQGVLDGHVTNHEPGSGRRREIQPSIVPMLVTLRRVADALGSVPGSTELLRCVVENYHRGYADLGDGIRLSW